MTAVGADNKHARRDEEARILSVRPDGRSSGSHVDLEEALHIDRFVYLRLVERVGGHFFAGYAPVGVEINQHGLAWIGFQGGIP